MYRRERMRRRLPRMAAALLASSLALAGCGYDTTPGEEPPAPDAGAGGLPPPAERDASPTPDVRGPPFVDSPEGSCSAADSSCEP